MMKKISAFLLAGVMLLVLAACGGSGRTLRGTYAFTYEDQKITYTFSGNRFTVTFDFDGEVTEGSGTFEVRDNILVWIDADGDESEVEFRLEGNTLTLVEAMFMQDLVLTRQ